MVLCVDFAGFSACPFVCCHITSHVMVLCVDFAGFSAHSFVCCARQIRMPQTADREIQGGCEPGEHDGVAPPTPGHQ